MLKKYFTWVVAILLAIMSGSAALGSIAKNKSPELALSVFPKNGFAAQAMASGLTMASVAKKNKGNFPDLVNPAWSAMARRAFESEAASPDAIAVLALSHTGNVRRELMQKAFELSRRQKFATGWLIADSGKRNQLPTLLDYYDTLLRTSSSAATVVMPVMVGALIDDESVAPLTALLDKNPPWADLFWRQVVSSPEALANAAVLRRKLHKIDSSRQFYHDDYLIEALVGHEQFENAITLYRLFSSQAGIHLNASQDSSRFDRSYPPLDWQLYSTGEYGSTITDKKLHVSAIRDSGGVFARKLVELPPGSFQVLAVLAEALPTGASLALELSCAQTTAKPLKVRINLNHQSTKQMFNNKGSGCSFFWLNITGRADEENAGFDMTIESISVSAKST